MQTQTAQIRVTLPVQLQGFLQAKASRYGLSLSAYIRNLIIDNVRDVEYPVFEMSKQSVAALKEAKDAEASGKLVQAKSIDQLLGDV